MDNNYGFNGYNEEPNKDEEHTYNFYEVNKEPEVTPTSTEPEYRSPKPQKPILGGIGKKIGFTVAMALVFGLIAGLVFQGVNLVGNKAFGTNESSSSSNVESVQMVPGSSDSSNTASNSTSDAAKATSVSNDTYSVADIAQSAMPSVVAITAVSVQEVQDFFGGTQQYEGVGSGSGIIIGQNDDELLIATNNHVVADSKNLSVSFYGDEIDASALNSEAAQTSNDMDEIAQEYAKNSVSASIKGTDADNDLAVIAVNKSDISDETMAQIKVATMGDSDSLAIGEQVVAIGNALGYGQSVTSGYVSALDRSIETDESGSTSGGLIQTDAAINPGNSGGALLNMKGEVIGINSAKFADTTVEGMGFAIPITTANPILDDLMSRETRTVVSEDQAAYMGISCKEVSSEVSQMYMIPSGVFVAEVTEGGPAEAAGMKAGDIITELDGTKISSYDELTNQLQYYAAGEKVDVVVQRADGGEYKSTTVNITLGSKKDAE